MAGATPATDKQRVSQLLSRINEAWLGGRPDDLAPLFHERIVMVLPGFAGTAEGREPVLAGFREFCDGARVLRFDESDRQVHVVHNVAVASFAFDITYERGGLKHRGTGRDLWVFSRSGGTWLAVWRTMVGVSEAPV